MNKPVIRRILIGIVIFLVAIIAMQFIRSAIISFEKKSAHEEVQKLVEHDLSFSWDSMDDDLLRITEMIDTKHLSNADLGRLYERASLIYMQKGEIMTYYRYLGYALYYLERSDDKDYTINVYLDLANFFLNNYTTGAAESMMEEAKVIEDFEDIKSLQIKSYAYRMLGIMAISHEDYDTATKYLAKAQELVDMSDTDVYEDAYTAINDVWLARVYAETGQYDKCREKLDKWEGNHLLVSEVFRQIMLRDLVIPFYQTKAILKAAEIFDGSENLTKAEIEAKEQELADALSEFMDLCEKNGYQKVELGTILELEKRYPPTSTKIRGELYSIVSRLYSDLFENQNIAYANVINNMVMDSRLEIEKFEQMSRQLRQRTQWILLGTIFITIVIIILGLVIYSSRFDALTGLLNRKNFNHDLKRARKRRQMYGIIMIDIDDFKQINDTYGHQKGDFVLAHLGLLMQKESTPDVHCYRYGGEEFAIILDQKAVPYISGLAERLRKTMSLQTWDFGDNLVITLSVGVAAGTGEDDLLKMADDNLYNSKNQGKNMVTD